MSTADGPGLVEVFAAAERDWATQHAAYRHPWWLPVAAGVWAFSLASGVWALDGGRQAAWLVSHWVVGMAFGWWESRRRPESHRTKLPKAYRTYHLVQALLLATFLGVFLLVVDRSSWAGPAIVGVAAGLGTWVANRTYDRITVSITKDVS